MSASLHAITTILESIGGGGTDGQPTSFFFLHPPKTLNFLSTISMHVFLVSKYSSSCVLDKGTLGGGGMFTLGNDRWNSEGP